MRLVGQIKCAFREGGYVVRGHIPLSEGEKVYDRRGNEIGVIDSVFGRVNEPYACIRTYGRFSGRGLEGFDIYTMESDSDAKIKGAKRRS